MDYILMESFVAYASIINIIKENIYMNKFVIKFLLDKINLSYEDLLKNFQVSLLFHILIYISTFF